MTNNALDTVAVGVTVAAKEGQVHISVTICPVASLLDLFNLFGHWTQETVAVYDCTQLTVAVYLLEVTWIWREVG